MKEDDRLRAAMGELMALVVHDLRNPVATISANISFVREVGATDVDANDALDDVEVAVGELTRGLDQLGWIGRWISGQRALDSSPGDVRAAVKAAVRKLGVDVKIDLPDEPIDAPAAGAPLSRLIEILVRNSLSHAEPASCHVKAYVEPGQAIIEVTDAGRAIGADLRAGMFGVEGQQALKGRTDGRYSRVAGLLAARTLGDAIGAQLEADGVDGAALFRIKVPL